MGIQERIKKLNQNGHKDKIENYLSKLEETAKLPTELQEVLSKIGNNPIKEPEIFTLAEDRADITEVLMSVYKKGNKKKDEAVKKEIAVLSKKHGLDVLVLFGRKIVSKVTDFENEDGSVKYTKNTENCDFPDIFQVKEYLDKQTELHKLFEAYGDIKDDVTALEDMSEEDKEKFNNSLVDLNEKTTKVSEELDAMSLSFSGLDVEVLSEWEKQTIRLNIDKYINKAYQQTVMGK